MLKRIAEKKHTPPCALTLEIPNPKLPAGVTSLATNHFSGRTEFQTIEESKRRAKIERSFSR